MRTNLITGVQVCMHASVCLFLYFDPLINLPIFVIYLVSLSIQSIKKIHACTLRSIHFACPISRQLKYIDVYPAVDVACIHNMSDRLFYSQLCLRSLSGVWIRLLTMCWLIDRNM